MPAVPHEFNRKLNIRTWLRGDDRRRLGQRRARSSWPLRILMIKAQAVIMIRQRVEG